MGGDTNFMGQAPASASTPGPIARATRAAGALLRRDWPVIALMIVVTIVIAYPVSFELGQWIIGNGGDSLQALWQDWWMRRTLAEGLSPTYTTYLFYPHGADLTFNAQHWSTLPIWWPLSVIVGDVAAENLTLLIGLVMSGYFAYLLSLYLTHNRAAALLSGVVFAFFPYHISQLGRSMSHMQWLPLFMLAFVHSLRTRKATHVLLAALALSMSTLTHQRLVVFAVLAGAVYGLYYLLSTGQWRSGRMWSALALFATLAIAFNLLPMLPFIRLSEEQMAQALAIDGGRGITLSAYVCPPPGSMLLSLLLQLGAPICHQGSRFYLGMTPIVLVMVGLVFGKAREWAPWALIAALFLGLALGPTLHIAGRSFPNIWTPYRVLDAIPIFGVMRQPERFNMGLALPWAVLVGYGTANILTRLRAGRTQIFLLAVLLGLTLAEYWGPVRRQSPQVSSYYYQLADEPGYFAIIELPMGREHSKKYMFNQTIHGKPMVEGMMSRPIGDPYAYIEGNPVLAAWRGAGPLPCDPEEYEKALDALLDDGFRYVIIHDDMAWDEPQARDDLLAYFTVIKPVYQDERIAVYELADLTGRPSCP
jgi:hypothetical protein